MLMIMACKTYTAFVNHAVHQPLTAASNTRSHVQPQGRKGIRMANIVKAPVLAADEKHPYEVSLGNHTCT